MIKASRSPSCFGHAFNLGGKVPYPLTDVAEKMTQLVPESSWNLVEFPAERKKIDIGDYYGDYVLASKLLGWDPCTGLDQGLEKTICYYKDNISYYL